MGEGSAGRGDADATEVGSVGAAAPRSLRATAAAGVAWSGVSHALRLAITIGTQALLARLLSVEEFGIVLMATPFFVFAMMLRDLGTAAAVIQRPAVEPVLLSSLFWANAGIGLVSLVLLELASPLVADFYGEPSVAPILRVLALSALLSSLGAVHQALLERRLAFFRLAAIEIAGAILGSVAALATALRSGGPWSLVAFIVVMNGATTALLWAFGGWRPSLAFSWPEVRQVSRFSLNLAAFSVAVFVARNGDNVLIGRYLGDKALGYYGWAYNLAFQPMRSMAAVVGRVAFPVLSGLQDDIGRLRRAYVRLVGSFAATLFPAVTGLAVVADDLVVTVLGPKWAPAVPVIRILAVAGFLQSVWTTVGVVYQAVGRTDLQLRVGGWLNALLVGSFVIGLPWGIVGVATAYAVMTVVVIIPGMLVPFGLIDLRLSVIAREIRAPLASTTVMVAGVIVARLLLPTSMVPAMRLAVTVPLGVAVYGAASWFLDRARVAELVRLVVPGARA